MCVSVSQNIIGVGSVMVWDVITSTGYTQLIMVVGKLIAVHFCNGQFFQHDNARPHVFKYYCQNMRCNIYLILSETNACKKVIELFFIAILPTLV